MARTGPGDPSAESSLERLSDGAKRALLIGVMVVFLVVTVAAADSKAAVKAVLHG